MERCSSGNVRQEGTSLVPYSFGMVSLPLEPGIEAIPIHIIEHIRHLSQFSPLEVYQWMNIWRKSQGQSLLLPSLSNHS